MAGPSSWTNLKKIYIGWIIISSLFLILRWFWPACKITVIGGGKKIHYTCLCYYSRKGRAIPSQRSLCVLAWAQWKQHGAEAVLCINARTKPGPRFLFRDTKGTCFHALCGCVLFMALWTLELVRKLSSSLITCRAESAGTRNKSPLNLLSLCLLLFFIWSAPESDLNWTPARVFFSCLSNMKLNRTENTGSGRWKLASFVRACYSLPHDSRSWNHIQISFKVNQTCLFYSILKL